MSAVQSVRGRLLIVTMTLGSLMFLTCSRRVEIEDEPNEPNVTQAPPLAFDGGVTVLDAGFDTDAFAPCSERKEGKCRGANDFVCEFGSWVPIVAEECQRLTGCKANGWLSVEIDDQGCAKSIGMEQPEEEFARCVIDVFGSHECPCSAQSSSYFLGLGNAGCADASTVH